MSKELQITRIESVKTFKREQKELHALEIIKSKIKIKLDYSISGTKGTHYFIETQEDIIPITKEEYDLLKEVLSWFM